MRDHHGAGTPASPPSTQEPAFATAPEKQTNKLVDPVLHTPLDTTLLRLANVGSIHCSFSFFSFFTKTPLFLDFSKTNQVCLF